MAAPSRRLYGLGVILCAALLACARISGPTGSPPYVITLGVAAVTYLCAIREFTRTPKFPRHVIIVCLAMSAVWRVPYQRVGPGPQDDVLRYVWDGRVQGAGINPYRYIPTDPHLAHLRDADIFPRINRSSYAPTIYPPAAQAIFYGVTRISERVTAMRAAMAAGTQ